MEDQMMEFWGMRRRRGKQTLPVLDSWLERKKKVESRQIRHRNTKELLLESLEVVFLLLVFFVCFFNYCLLWRSAALN